MEALPFSMPSPGLPPGPLGRSAAAPAAGKKAKQQPKPLSSSPVPQTPPAEVWERRVAARQRQVDIGKARPEYARYLHLVPKEQRRPSRPNTPDPRAAVSKRMFDRQLSEWRRELHKYEDPDKPSPDEESEHAESEASDDEEACAPTTLPSSCDPARPLRPAKGASPNVAPRPKESSVTKRGKNKPTPVFQAIQTAQTTSAPMPAVSGYSWPLGSMAAAAAAGAAASASVNLARVSAAAFAGAPPGLEGVIPRGPGALGAPPGLNVMPPVYRVSDSEKALLEDGGSPCRSHCANGPAPRRPAQTAWPMQLSLASCLD
eukprot:TRINITY_DN21806_c0_g1_i1.p1 TRINITY_DN21806_c0_g1~~TRINITY_DN21806_c0_g1_i1.p1  ORF type:complete len:317 (-),score=35.05 TRINITY_DN21806_c0_g1_i1:243-1193(-)